MSDTYHFIGIGGIGMSAIARILLQKKSNVKGSDIKSNKVIEDLIQNGANIQIGHKADFVTQNDIIVFSTDIKDDNPEYIKAKELNLKILHRSEILNQLTVGKMPLLITGTHGKTTTTSLVTEVLLEANEDPSFVIGGILNSKKTNGCHGSGKYFVAEADESDGSFLKTLPFGAIVTNLEKEHLNYWKTFEKLKVGFSNFFSNVISEKHLFWCYEDENLKMINPKGFSYGFSKGAKLRAENIRSKDFQMIYDIKFMDKTYKDVKINLIGKHNVLNSLSVFGLCLQLQIKENVIRKTFENFKGVSRRLEKVGESQKTIFFDDYAHHPTEIENTLRSLRSVIKEKKMICVFQAHRYTRLKDLFEEFSKAFDEVDELIITNIYSANEKPIDGINEKKLIELIKKRDIDVKFVEDSILEEYILKNVKPFDVVIALGAGDISSKIRKIASSYSQNQKKISLGILFGGISNEHDIAIRSTKNFDLAFDRSLYDIKYFKINKDGSWIFDKNKMPTNETSGNKKISYEIFKELTSLDVCFPIFHGPFGEDGMIGAFLETLEIPYIGTDYFTSAIGMDKAFSKHIAKANGVPILDFIEVNSYEWKDNKDLYVSKILKKFDLPVYIKPNHLGSSIGIKIVDNKDNLKEAIDYVFTFDNSLIIEERLDARELQASVIGNDYIIIGEIGEMLTEGAFFDYQNKYEKSVVTSKLPIDVSEEKLKEIKEIALKVYSALKISGFSRIDMFLDKKNLDVYFNEINPIPGYSSNNSMFPKMLDFIGIDKKNMVDLFVIYAFHKKRKNKRLIKTDV